MFFNAPDYNSLPGNDQLVTMGAYAASPDPQTCGNLGLLCAQWRTLAHELGHTLGLRHGGTDFDSDKGTAYNSLMSYSWQLQCDVVSAVQSYSGATDTTLRLGSPSSTTSRIRKCTWGTPRAAVWALERKFPGHTEQSTRLRSVQNGPLDTTPPVVSFNARFRMETGAELFRLQLPCRLPTICRMQGVTISLTSTATATLKIPAKWFRLLCLERIPTRQTSRLFPGPWEAARLRIGDRHNRQCDECDCQRQRGASRPETFSGFALAEPRDTWRRGVYADSDWFELHKRFGRSVERIGAGYHIRQRH